MIEGARSACEDDTSAVSALCAEAVAVDKRNRDRGVTGTIARVIGLSSLSIAVYAGSHSIFIASVTSLSVGMLLMMRQVSREPEQARRRNASLFLDNCWETPRLRLAHKKQREKRDVATVARFQRIRRASDLAWGAVWRQRENIPEFDRVLPSKDLRSAEMLEELLAGEETRLPVLKRLSQGDWETVRGWAESHDTAIQERRGR